MNKYTDLVRDEFEDIAEAYVNEAYISGQTIESLNWFLGFLPGKGKVLDIGCGGGQDSQQFRAAGYKIVGIDFSREMIKLAKSFVRRGKFIVGDFFEEDFKDEYFTAIWCMRVFLVIPLSRQQEFLNKAYRVLKPGGFMYLSTKANATDTEGVDDRGVFRKLITEDTFKMLIKRAGFDLVDFRRKGSFMEAVFRK